MGYYIQTPHNKGKAKYIAEKYGGTIVDTPPSFENISPDKAIICVVDNGGFEAAGFCFSQSELHDFSYFDGRPRTWVIIDRKKACELTGYVEEVKQ